MRSILKKPGQSSLRKTLLTKHSPPSQIGITQALNILQTSSPSIQFITPQKHLSFQTYESKLENLPYNFYFKESDIVTFDLKSTIDELFLDEDIIMTSIVKNSLICLDSTDEQIIQTSSSKKRKLRFDESSICDTSYVARPKKSGRKRGNFHNLDDVSVGDDELKNFLIQMEEEKQEANKEYEDDYNEILGNNNRNNSTNSSVTSDKIYNEKFGGMNSSTSTDKSSDSEISLNEREVKKRKRAKKAFFLSQAALSGSDHDETDDDQLNEYDLKDSFVDCNDYTQNGMND